MKKSNWINGRDWPPTIAILFLLLTAIFVPPDSLSKFVILNQFCDWLSTFFPFIEKYANFSLFPDATRLTLSLSMAFIPFVFPPFIWYQLRALDIERFKNHKLLMRWGWVSFPLTLFPFFLDGPVVKQARFSSFIDHLVVISKIAMGIFAGAMMFYVVFFATAAILWAKIVFSGDK